MVSINETSLKRSDDRNANDFRPVSIQCNVVTSAHGSAIARIGESSVLVAIKGELVAPKSHALDSGFINVSFDFACIGPNDQSENESLNNSVAMQFIEDLLLSESDGFVDLKQLGIVRKLLCWVLYFDIMIIDTDGPVEDVLLLAVVTALKNCKLPHVDAKPCLPGSDQDSEAGDQNRMETSDDVDDVIADQKGVRLKISVDNEKLKPLKLSGLPQSVTFALSRSLLSSTGSIPLVDPTSEEVTSSDNSILRLVIGKEDNNSEPAVLDIHKSGAISFSKSGYSGCIKQAISRWKYLKCIVDECTC